MLENPPPEKPAAVSGTPVVPPTEVTYGHVDGKVGTDCVQPIEAPPTPESLEANYEYLVVILRRVKSEETHH